MITLIRWEDLRERLEHLAALAELLPAFVAVPDGVWLWKQIMLEADQVAEIAYEYLVQALRDRDRRGSDDR